jgi:hypothetical protein
MGEYVTDPHAADFAPGCDLVVELACPTPALLDAVVAPLSLMRALIGHRMSDGVTARGVSHYVTARNTVQKT